MSLAPRMVGQEQQRVAWLEGDFSSAFQEGQAIVVEHKPSLQAAAILFQGVADQLGAGLGQGRHDFRDPCPGREPQFHRPESRPQSGSPEQFDLYVNVAGQ